MNLQGSAMNGMTLKNALCRVRGPWGCVIALAVFWVCILRNAELPGLYMDAINPDYLVARWLNPGLANPVWVMPGPSLPLLGNLYHGTQTMFIGLLTYGVLGTSVVSARVAQAIFGAAIVLLTWLILRRAAKRPLLAMVVATALATDMAFIGSFRTQAYIILAGQAWMMLALYLAMRSSQQEQPSPWSSLLSGVSMGLAVYGYFVFLFFLLPIAALAILGGGRNGAGRRACLWALGFVIGMLPYVIGYVWLAVDVGGIGPFVEWMRGALAGLKPTSGSSSYLAGLASAVQNARLGLTGSGNEIMMIGESVSSGFAILRVGMTLLATAVCLVGAWLDWRRTPREARLLAAFAMLPLVYVLAAAWFGSRLWVHHFTVLVAVEYLTVGMAAAWLGGQGGKLRWQQWTGAVLAVVLLVVNVVQQNRVHAQLVRTGGVGMSTDALPALARAALTEKNSSVWFFPDWGFFMPFMFLTGNQVPYENELTADSLRRHLGGRRGVRVAFWKEEDQQRHRKLLEANGIGDIRLYRMDRRDGQPALYVLSGQETGATITRSVQD